MESKDLAKALYKLTLENNAMLKTLLESNADIELSLISIKLKLGLPVIGRMNDTDKEFKNSVLEVFRAYSSHLELVRHISLFGEDTIDEINRKHSDFDVKERTFYNK